MPRSPVLFPLLLLLLPQPPAHGFGLRGAGSRIPECGPCRPERCPAPSRCPAPGIAALDECGCCTRCLGSEGASCGGRAGTRCGPGLVCASRAAGTAPEGTGLCVCAQRGTVCGSDGHSYPSVCALRLRARHEPRAHLGHLRKARDGPCEFAPVVITPPQSVHNVTGAQVYLSCEVRAVPTPVVTWRKVFISKNFCVCVWGGVIKPLRKEDEGVYQCHSANAVGEAQSHGTVTVVDGSQYGAARFLALDDRM
uniref:Insulin-like growth factor-binding protein-like 1 n=1 Tax=Sus scrofa TaxID=9823 RepID=A0A8D0WNT8_PIG